jgi:hypothetical protein
MTVRLFSICCFRRLYSFRVIEGEGGLCDSHRCRGAEDFEELVVYRLLFVITNFGGRRP